jgi:hypothetical protein
VSEVRSKDGTTIAYDRSGNGPALVIVDGAFCSRAFGPSAKLAPLPAVVEWILGFGAMARVLSPKSLAHEVHEEIEATRERYMPKLRFEPLKMTLESRHMLLPAPVRMRRR